MNYNTSTKKPHKLFDKLKQDHNLPSDRALAYMIDTTPAQISKIRAGKLNASAAMLLRIHEHCHLSFVEMRELLKPDGA